MWLHCALPAATCTSDRAAQHADIHADIIANILRSTYWRVEFRDLFVRCQHPNVTSILKQQAIPNNHQYIYLGTSPARQ